MWDGVSEEDWSEWNRGASATVSSWDCDAHIKSFQIYEHPRVPRRVDSRKSPEEHRTTTLHVAPGLVMWETVKRMFETNKKKMIMWLLWAQSENKIMGFGCTSLFFLLLQKYLQANSGDCSNTSLAAMPAFVPGEKGVASVVRESLSGRTSALDSIGGALSQAARLGVCLDPCCDVHQQTQSAFLWQIYGWCTTHVRWCVVFSLYDKDLGMIFQSTGPVAKVSPILLLHSTQIYSIEMEK